MAPDKNIRRMCILLALVGIQVFTIRGSAPEGLPIAFVLDQQSGFTASFPSAMAVDREGRIWVSSDLGGLFVGDGLHFLKVELPPALSGQSIGSMAADPSGRLWVLSSGGLGTLEKGKWRVDTGIRQYEPMHPARIDGIFSHPSGTLAIMASGQAFSISGDSQSREVLLPGDDAAGEAGLAWLGNRLVVNRRGRFWREDGDAWTALPTIPLSPAELQHGPLRTDGAGHLYLLTDMNLYHLAPGAGSWLPVRDIRLDRNSQMNLLQDGRIWILQFGQALCAYKGTITRRPLPGNVTSPGAKALYLDREENIWITNGALARVPALGMVRVHAGPGSPPAEPVWRIRRDPAGKLWVTSESGLYRQDDSGWRAVPGVAKAHSMGIGPDGWLYVCDQSRLIRVDTRSLMVETVKVPLLPPGIAVRRGPVIQGEALWAIDALGRLLLGSWGRNGWSWTWDPLPEMAERAIRDILQDDMGRPWAIFADQVYCRVKGRWERLPSMTGHRGGGPMGVSFRSEAEGLAAQYDPPAVLSVRRGASGWATSPRIGPDQLRNPGVLYSIGQDPQGTIWVGSDRGIIRFAPGDPPRFQQIQGLPSDDTDQGALLVEGSERVWVGTTLGLVEIRAREMGAIPLLAAPSILGVRRDSWAAQGPDSVLDIQYGRGPISWELGFSGPVAGHDAHFEFRKLGGPWTALSGTALQFPMIDSGHHAYEIRIVPANGPPGPAKRMDIFVHPPWYRHSLAYMAWGALAVALVILSIRGRFALLHKRNRELNRKVKLATMELRRHRDTLEKKVDERTSELRLTSKALQASESRYRHLFESSPDGIVLIGLKGLILQSNDSQSRMFGYGSPADLIGVHATQLVSPSARDHSARIMSRRLNGEDIPPVEYELVRKNGTLFYGEISATILRSKDGAVTGYICITRDTTERKRTEEQIRASLKEKEVLLREIHHRVKNNLQVISGLLTLQADQAAGRSLEDLVRESQDRIRTMALIHEKLFQSHNLSEIAFDDYLHALTDSLFASYGIGNCRIRAVFSLEPVHLSIEKAIPLGLMVNELVCNSIKHAFPGGRHGEIHISLRVVADSGFPACELIITDNGIGLPEDFVLQEQKSLGMHLVHMLARQLQATINTTAAPGGGFRITIPMEQKIS
jgi:PAS domain S-box-containing protein